MRTLILGLLCTLYVWGQNPDPVMSVGGGGGSGGGGSVTFNAPASGNEVVKNATGTTFNQRGIVGGTGITCTQGTDTITCVINGSIVTIWSSGTTAPSANCTAGSEIYTDTTAGRMYRCGPSNNTWTELSRISSGSGAPGATACDAAAEVGALYYRTDNTSGAGGHYGCAQTGSGTYAWVLLSGSGAVTASSTDTFTNKTLDAEGSGNIVTAPSQIYLEAGGCQNTTASLAWNTNATGPGSSCAGTNATEGTADFDAATDEGMHRRILLPDDFTGTVDVALVAFAAATTGTARVGINIDCSASTEDFDPAITNATTFNFTPSGTTNRPVVTTQTGITITGCAANELARIRLYRDADGTSGTDDMTGDLRVIGLRLKIRRAM